MAIKYCDGVSTYKRANGPLKDAIAETFTKCEKLMEEFNFSEFHKVIWELIGACNSYIEKTEPFTNIRSAHIIKKTIIKHSLTVPLY